MWFGNSIDQIPSAFIITGPNIASQDLLFEQLSESLQQSTASKFVRLKSPEAVTLKAALKKTIRDAMADVGDTDKHDLQIESAQDVSDSFRILKRRCGRREKDPGVSCLCVREGTGGTIY